MGNPERLAISGRGFDFYFRILEVVAYVEGRVGKQCESALEFLGFLCLGA